ncbi:ferritin-like domain-containing protein [Methylomagnum ishizawai]|uniref:ferritin-like domain-containing protein n=1 Tax=Methylomagnum ishizawai TaxID=1760988 RepID=UPI001C33B2BE|nr:ferritin-like domain-containing protein [Methylomagnum ishizawai]BBL74411.1 hypothetical protein MishRS11D_15090 [Methylomagnum ishizawai]
MPTESFHALAEACLYSPSIAAKLAATDRAAAALASGHLDFAAPEPPRPATAVRFPERPRLVDPRDLPRRGLHTDAGRLAFLHALAHIEFTAIHLAFDIGYRFRDMPDAFRLDWLRVAIEEAKHFRALDRRLQDFGGTYGDCPAHRGLWDLAETTADDVLARLALVPRFMEARGLDVSPGMIAKLRRLGDAESVAILEMILREEIGHVAFGTRWFREVCAARGLEPEAAYFELVRTHVKGAVRGPFNREARLAAGFGEGELAWLEALEAGSSARTA